MQAYSIFVYVLSTLANMLTDPTLHQLTSASFKFLSLNPKAMRVQTFHMEASSSQPAPRCSTAQQVENYSMSVLTTKFEQRLETA